MHPNFSRSSCRRSRCWPSKDELRRNLQVVTVTRHRQVAAVVVVPVVEAVPPAAPVVEAAPPVAAPPVAVVVPAVPAAIHLDLHDEDLRNTAVVQKRKDVVEAEAEASRLQGAKTVRAAREVRNPVNAEEVGKEGMSRTERRMGGSAGGRAVDEAVMEEAVCSRTEGKTVRVTEMEEHDYLPVIVRDPGEVIVGMLGEVVIEMETEVTGIKTGIEAEIEVMNETVAGITGITVGNANMRVDATVEIAKVATIESARGP